MKPSWYWLTGLAAIAAASLAGCGAAAQVQPESSPQGQEADSGGTETASTGGDDESTVSQPPAAPTENYGPAPEISNEVWLNTDAPIRIAEQRGKVVLVEFWTFG